MLFHTDALSCLASTREPRAQTLYYFCLEIERIFSKTGSFQVLMVSIITLFLNLIVLFALLSFAQLTVLFVRG